MKGRKAKPDALKLAQGNPGKRHISIDPENETPEELPEITGNIPSELSERARGVWKKLVPELSRMRFLKESDRAAFTRYCEYCGEWWRLTKDIEAEGTSYWTESAHGKMQRINPKFIVRERIEKSLERLDDRFGLNPAARQQMMQRLAGVLPSSPPGGLFGEETDEAEAEGRPHAASPIGMLRGGVLH